TACVCAASPVLAASRSFTDHVSRFLAAALKSAFFCQISGLAADFSGLSEPSGNSLGISFDVDASVSASGTMAAICPALVLSWMFFQALPCSFMSFWRVSMASAAVIFFSPMLAHPATTTRARPPTTTRIIRVLMSPPVGGGNPHRVLPFPSCGWGNPRRVPPFPSCGLLLADLVAHRGNRLQILCDRQPIGLGEVLVARQGAVDDLGHQAAGHVAIRLVAAAEVIGDLLDRPLADTGFLVRGDVRHGFVFRAFGIPAEE